MSTVHCYPFTVAYQDTDFSGVVRHSNYLKIMERAREELCGREHLSRLYSEEGIAIAIYRAELSFKDAPRHGELLEVRFTVRKESDYRLVFEHNVWRTGTGSVAVKGVVELVCVNKAQKLVALPPSVAAVADR